MDKFCHCFSAIYLYKGKYRDYIHIGLLNTNNCKRKYTNYFFKELYSITMYSMIQFELLMYLLNLNS